MEDPAARLTNSGGAAQPSDSSPLAGKESRLHISGRFLSLSIFLLDWINLPWQFLVGLTCFIDGIGVEMPIEVI
jgi:hypothetical protein